MARIGWEIDYPYMGMARMFWSFAWYCRVFCCLPIMILIQIDWFFPFFFERKGDSAKDRKDVEAGSNSGLMKKTRTKISLYQKLELECAFLQTPYPSRAVRAHLAHRLGLKHQTLLVSYTLSNWNLTRVTKKKQNGVKVPSQVHAYLDKPQS